MHDSNWSQPYAVRRCHSGCLHVDLGGGTLHLSEDQFLILVSLENSAHREILSERTGAASEAHAGEDLFVM